MICDECGLRQDDYQYLKHIIDVHISCTSETGDHNFVWGESASVS